MVQMHLMHIKLDINNRVSGKGQNTTFLKGVFMKGFFAAVLSVLMMASSLIPGGTDYYDSVKAKRADDGMYVVMSVDCDERDS